MEDVKKVLFSREQYEHLNKTFPEILGTANTKPEEFYIQSGKRTIVEYIRSRMK